MLFRPKVVVHCQKSIRFLNLYSSQVIFSDENKKNCVEKLQTMMPIKVGSKGPRTAAVLIPLCIHKQHVSLLYTLRAANLSSHRGQVSFPGGMKDDNDKSLEITALRETHEELGIPPEHVEIWGSGNLIITKQNMSILPVVGCLKQDLSMDKLVLNDSEVEEVFAVPLHQLCQSNLNKHTQFRHAYSTPVFLAGHRRIWGLTAVMTHLFLKALLPPTAYNHKVTYLPNVASSR